MSEEASDRWDQATLEMVATVPTTAAGLVAILTAFEAGTAGCLVDPDGYGLNVLLATVRTFITGKA